MCSIWEIREHDDVSPDVYRKLPGTLRDVNLSGGEPFLRRDLPRIVDVIHGRVPRARIVVSTNGFMGTALVQRAIALLEKFPQIGFAFAVDGVGEEHDRIRRVPGGYRKVLAAIEGLRRSGIGNIRIAYTLTRDNADQMIEVYRLAEDLGVQFTMQVSHDSDLFFGINESSIVKAAGDTYGGDKLREPFERIIRGELSTYDIKKWGRAFVFYGIFKLITEGKQLFGSRPGVDYFYLDPSGNVYPSVMHNHIMGNLRDSDFDSIWHSERSEEVRRKCREDKRPYWMGCMLRKALLEHRLQIGWWALRNKYLGLRM